MKIYFMGICGTAMGNVAVLCKQMGYDVIGADEAAYPPMSNVLRDAGVRLHEGYDAVRLKTIMPDLVIVGNSIPRGNPEVEWLLEERAFAYTSLPQFLSDHVLKMRKSVVVTGTHGKTTTSALAAYLIKNNNANPGYLIGGVPLDFPLGSYLGAEKDPFVIEGDEYDSAFFDKRSKFIHYFPTVLTINNVEFDHADIFRDLEDVQRTFRHMLRLVPRNGSVVINGDDPNIEALMPVPWTTVLRVGVGDSNDLRIVNYKESAEGSKFELHWKGELCMNVEWNQHGLYNARNAAVAILAAKEALNISDIKELSIDSLKEFKGVKRRQEVLHNAGGLIVFEDFAHHPTSVEEAIKAFRSRFPHHRITICFEPRCNTMQKDIFQSKLAESFKGADIVCLGPVFEKELFAGSKKLDTCKLCEDIAGKNKNVVAKAFESNSSLLEFALSDYKSNLGKKPQVYCFLTNGAFDGIINQFVESVRN